MKYALIAALLLSVAPAVAFDPGWPRQYPACQDCTKKQTALVKRFCDTAKGAEYCGTYYFFSSPKPPDFFMMSPKPKNLDLWRRTIYPKISRTLPNDAKWNSPPPLAPETQLQHDFMWNAAPPINPGNIR
jgi:hypothetical protein